MPKTNTTTANRDKEGRVRTNIPKALAEAMGMTGGEQLEWSVASQNTLKVRVRDDGDSQ